MEPAGQSDEVRFLCDRMLGRLCRWLRAAGYDAAMAQPGDTDRTLVLSAREQGRLLLTRDRRVLEIRHAAGCTHLLAGNGLEAAVAGLSLTGDVDWLYRPFSRCLLCNRPLKPAPADWRRHVPPHVRARDGEVLHCPSCGKLYWPGGHMRRMRKQLDEWQRQRTSR
jgi:uncharacterized protein with PIN domain